MPSRERPVVSLRYLLVPAAHEAQNLPRIKIVKEDKRTGSVIPLLVRETPLTKAEMHATAKSKAGGTYVISCLLFQGRLLPVPHGT